MKKIVVIILMPEYSSNKPSERVCSSKKSEWRKKKESADGAFSWPLGYQISLLLTHMPPTSSYVSMSINIRL